MTTHVETVVVGAGQVGLPTAYHLTQAGRSCLALDAGERVGDGWRQQWDWLRLYSPARWQLPRDAVPRLPVAPPGQDELAEYLETCTRTSDSTGAGGTSETPLPVP
jgi:putative flavoprotein involved in K+ transport